jgi:hypothetical protein
MEPPVWKKLPFYLQFKYFAEIIAICVALFLLAINAYQLKLLHEQNKIILANFRASFPLNIETKLIEYKDGHPIIIKIGITNIVKDKIKLYGVLLPKLVLNSSNKIENGISLINTILYKKERPKSNSFKINNEMLLNPNENCILEITADIEVGRYYKKDDIFKYKPEDTAFIILPICLSNIEDSAVRSIQKTIIIYLSRMKDRSLNVYSEVLDITDDDTLLLLIRIHRTRLSVPE